MFGGVSQNTYVSGSSGAGGIPPNNNNVQNQPTVSHAPPGSPRPFTTTVAQIQNQQGALERGVIFPPGSRQAFGVRNPEALAHLQVGHTITMVVNPQNNLPYVALPTVHPATQQNYVNLIPLTPVERAREAVRNWRAQAAVHQPGHQQMQHHLQQTAAATFRPEWARGTFARGDFASLPNELLQHTFELMSVDEQRSFLEATNPYSSTRLEALSLTSPNARDAILEQFSN